MSWLMSCWQKRTRILSLVQSLVMQFALINQQFVVWVVSPLVWKVLIFVKGTQLLVLVWLQTRTRFLSSLKKDLVSAPLRLNIQLKVVVVKGCKLLKLLKRMVPLLVLWQLKAMKIWWLSLIQVSWFEPTLPIFHKQVAQLWELKWCAWTKMPKL